MMLILPRAFFAVPYRNADGRISSNAEMQTYLIGSIIRFCLKRII